MTLQANPTFRCEITYGYATISPRSNVSFKNWDEALPNGLHTRVEDMKMLKGECMGCGAPYVTHPLSNANTSETCSYCRLPRFQW